jgi:hypothetical protein
MFLIPDREPKGLSMRIWGEPPFEVFSANRDYRMTVPLDKIMELTQEF